MTTDDNNFIQINDETFGKATDPAIVLIMGLGEQIVAWPDLFCRMLADAGFYVVRFDNRDTGLSTKCDGEAIPDLRVAWESYFQDKLIVTAYSLKDMAADVTGLLNQLNIPEAFICGFSLGGMIAQNMAFSFPERMWGLICMGSSSGDRQLPPPRPEAQAAMGTPAPQTRQGYIDHTVAVFKTFSNGSPFYDAQCRSANENHFPPSLIWVMFNYLFFGRENLGLCS